MPSNQDTKNDPHDTLEIAPDVVLVARAAAEFPSLAPDTASQPFNRQPNMGNMGAAPDLTAAPKVDATFRASDVNDIPGARLGGRWLRTASMAFMFALISVIATAAWQRYGNEAQAMMATGFPPRIDLASWLPWQKSDAAAPADTSTSSPAPTTVATAADQAATSAPAAAQPADNAAAATTATPATAAPAAAVSPQAPPAQDPTQALQSMSRDVASLTQQIETLKASIAELKANQEQLAHEISNPPRDQARGSQGFGEVGRAASCQVGRAATSAGDDRATQCKAADVSAEPGSGRSPAAAGLRIRSGGDHPRAAARRFRCIG
jgi:hypothetical protein